MLAELGWLSMGAYFEIHSLDHFTSYFIFLLPSYRVMETFFLLATLATLKARPGWPTCSKDCRALPFDFMLADLLMSVG